MTPRQRAEQTQINVCACNCLRDGNKLLCPSAVDTLERAISDAVTEERDRCALAAEHCYKYTTVNIVCSDIPHAIAAKIREAHD